MTAPPAAPLPPPVPSLSLLERVLQPGERILWSGRPRTGLAPGDGEAAIVGAILVFSTLGTLSVLLDWDEALGPARAGLAACVFGLALAYGRATTSGATLTLGLALQAPMLALAAAKGGLAALDALVCPATNLLFLVAWAARRGLGSRGLRYHLSAGRGFIERPGRFVVSFEFEGPPEVVPSRLGGGDVGSVRFLASHGRLSTAQGALQKVPGPQCRFVRVEAPWELVDAWEQGGDPAAA